MESSNSSQTPLDQELVHEEQLARLVEFGVVNNFEYVAKYHVPTALGWGGCAGFSRMDMDLNPRNNDGRLRQEYLARSNKTEQQIEESDPAVVAESGHGAGCEVMAFHV